jgi:hypothetical protein
MSQSHLIEDLTYLGQFIENIFHLLPENEQEAFGYSYNKANNIVLQQKKLLTMEVVSANLKEHRGRKLHFKRRSTLLFDNSCINDLVTICDRHLLKTIV